MEPDSEARERFLRLGLEQVLEHHTQAVRLHCGARAAKEGAVRGGARARAAGDALRRLHLGGVRFIAPTPEHCEGTPEHA